MRQDFIMLVDRDWRFFFFQAEDGIRDVAVTGVQTCALPIFIPATITMTTGTMFLMWLGEQITERGVGNGISMIILSGIVAGLPGAVGSTAEAVDRKSTRLNSSHGYISYAGFCLQKKKAT